MKSTFTMFLLALAVGIFAQQTPMTDDDFESVVCKEADAHKHHFHQKERSASALTSNYDLKYYRFEWYIDPAQYYIDGKATVYFEVLADGFNEINFDLSSQLAVNDVSYHGQGLSSSASGDYLLTIPLPAQLPVGTMDSLTITYSGAPPSGGFGSFIQSNHANTPVLWTLSEPYGSQDWWPCKNGLTDKIDSIDVIITTPAAYRAASNGRLVSETLSGPDKVYHWKHRYPIAPYLVAIAVTNYAQYTDNVLLSNGTNMPMLNYVYPENLTNAQTGTAKLVQVLQFYDSLFVTYPFHEEKYGHAEFGWGGGMEHQTMSFVTSYGWGLLTHELAHQWFGDMVTCGSWEDIWLNEGFATYLEGISRERFPSQVQTQWYDWKAGKIGSIVSQPGGSVMVDDTTTVNRIFSSRLSYNKGAYLLHMLRWKLGEDAFFVALRNYLNERAHDYAHTHNLQTHLEATSGQDLDEYFEDWFRGQGFPSYKVVWEQSSQGDVYIQLNQTTSMPSSVDFFEMPVPILLIGEDNDTIVRLEHTQNGELFSMNIPFEVTGAYVDPDLWLISANNTVQQGELTGTGEAFADGKLLVYPNPAVDFLQVFIKEQSEAIGMEWSMVNGLGQTVQLGSSDADSFKISLSDMPSGLYRLLLRNERGEVSVRNFVKE
jgi:aminopeptidase N